MGASKVCPIFVQTPEMSALVFRLEEKPAGGYSPMILIRTRLSRRPSNSP
jgi:hypothetical protein